MKDNRRMIHNVSPNYIINEYLKYANKPITINKFNSITEKIACKYFSKINPVTYPQEFYEAYQPMGLYYPKVFSFHHLTMEYLYENGYGEDNDEIILYDVIDLFPSEYTIAIYFTFDNKNKITIIDCDMES